MVALTGHFDGKVIVPDEPVNLPVNQRLIVHLEPVAQSSTDYRSWLGLGKRASENPHPQFRNHREIWE